VRSILSKAKLGSHPDGRPPAAVELAPQGVLAAATPAPGQAPVFAFEPLKAGALTPGIAEQNVKAPEAVAGAMRSALGKVSPRSRAVTLVVPDSVVRVFILDFDSLPSKAAEAVPVLRFRLRKMLPFDVEHAGLSYQMLSENKTECRVLAAVLPGPILAEYEAVVRQAGYEPGAVLSSSLAALAGLDKMEAVLVANLTDRALTTSIANGQDLLLFRTLDLPEDPGLRLDEVQRDIAVASAFYEDKLGARPHVLHFAGGTSSGHSTAEEFGVWLNDPEMTVTEMAPRPETGATTAWGSLSVAGVTGALAGAV
jgi:type IV pilus assembly protein PilM